MNLEKLKQRDSALDIVRIFAVFSVIGVHFFLNTYFYSTPLEGSLMFFMSLIRTFFNVCVPLFMILTGYLMCNKTLSNKYYSGITKTIIVFVLASIACIAFKGFYLQQDMDLKTAIISIFDFSGASYSWYIEMYIGLFLIAPFLNLAYNGLKTQKHKQILVFTFVAICILPTLFNIYNFYVPGWWSNPTISTEYSSLYPDYWLGTYPLAYYFTGCYFREYGMKIKTKPLALLLFVSLIVFNCFNFYRCQGTGYSSGQFGYWYGFESYVLSALLFVLLTRINTEKYSVGTKWTLWKLSDLALGIYLFSYIFDQIFYGMLKNRVNDFHSQSKYFLLMVPVVFICSALASGVANYLTQVILFLYKKIKDFVIKQIELNKKLFWQDVLFGVLIIGAVIFAFWKTQFGFGGNDEAFYLTIPDRLLQGDALIKDEWHLSQLSGFLLMPFVAIFNAVTGSSEGIILTARIVYVIFHAAVATFIYIKLRNNGVWTAIASVMFFLFTPYNIMAYSYNTMGMDLIAITGVLLGTANYEKKISISVIVSGLTFAAAVLCCPYLIIAYVLFVICVVVRCALKKVETKCVIKSQLFTIKTFLLFTLGAGVLAIIFVGFMLSRISIKEFFDYLPYLMTDPEHPTIPFFTRISYYFSSFVKYQDYFKYLLFGYAVMLIIMAFDKKRKTRRSVYLIWSTLIALVFYVTIFSTAVSYHYNAVMLPILFIGLTSYFLCENKQRIFFVSGFILPVIYSFAIHFSSNQQVFIIVVALSIANIASCVFLGNLFKEIKETPDEVNYSILLKRFAVCFVTFLMFIQAGVIIKVKSEHCFWETGNTPETLTSQITMGPAKGIYTKDTTKFNYEQIYNDLYYYKSKGNKNILCLTEKTWCYLAIEDMQYATLSAWLPETDATASIGRLESFYMLNPEKSPQYIYIPKDSSWDCTYIESIAAANGYSVFENSVSYKLEKVQ